MDSDIFKKGDSRGVIRERYTMDELAPTIPPNLAIKFKSATESQRHKIREILMANYASIIDAYVDADYISTDGCWINHTPISYDIVLPSEFIKKYTHLLKLKPKQKNEIL